MNDSVEELVRRARNGGKAAFDELTKMFEDRVFRQCSRYLKNEADAEEEAQETFLMAWKNLEHLRDDRAFGRWLLTIASRVCLRQLQRRKLDIVSLDDPHWQGVIDALASKDSGLKKIEQQVLAEQLWEMIHTEARQNRPPWDPMDLLIFGLRCKHGLTEVQIAKKLKLIRTTVHFRLTSRIYPVLTRVGKRLENEMKQI